MSREELTAWALAHGWERDRLGHLQKAVERTDNSDADCCLYRLKLSQLAVRYEVKTAHGWVRLKGNYLRKISVTPDGKLAGLLREGCGA